MLRPARAFVVLLFAITLTISAPAQTSSDAQQRADARSFIASVAQLIYTTAWPTATFRSFNIDSIDPGPGNTLDITTRFDGVSHWDDSDLWLLLTVRLGRNGIEDVFVRRHNAILAEPFATARALGQLTLALTQQYQKRSSTPEPGNPPTPSTLRAPTGQTASAPQTQPTAPGLAGAVCINNSTSYTVHFAFRWGDAEWQPIDLQPQQAESIWWPYSDENHVSPALTIYYSEQGASAPRQHTYTLRRSQARLPIICSNATNYNFLVENGALNFFLVPATSSTASGPTPSP